MEKYQLRRAPLPILTLTNAAGLFFVSYAFYCSVLKYASLSLECFFFLGLLLMFVPNLLQLLSASPSRLERIYLLCILGICFYLVQFIGSPLHFSSFDDFLHWHTLADILRTGHLFSFNSMLPVSPYYPGLEIVTDAVSTMTGLGPFYAGVLVIVASRLLMVLSLFLFYERITDSSRLAGIGTLIYMVNPHFIFFDAIFNYETLALPLATFMLYILARFGNGNRDSRWVLCSAWFVLAAVTLTHHMTDYVFIGLLMLWAAVSLFRPSSAKARLHLISIALLGLMAALAYAFLLPGNPVWAYLSAYYEGAFGELRQIIAGTSGMRLFSSSTGQAVPLWDSVLRTTFVALVTFFIPFGLLGMWRRYRQSALAITLGIFSLAYPITQVFRFTRLGSEIPDRAAAFLFLSVACVLVLSMILFFPMLRLNRRAIALITGILAVMFVGGVLIEIGSSYEALPGPYAVSADGLSIEPEGIEDAEWSLAYLGPDNRVGTDRVNQMLMSTYGDQHVVTRLGDNVDIAPIFYAAKLGPDEIDLMQYAGIHYLVVDLRLSTSLPLVGFYFENDRPTSPISREALTKFNTVPLLDRVFDSGNIIIYDTGELADGPGQ